jgi:hypothetical protein
MQTRPTLSDRGTDGQYQEMIITQYAPRLSVNKRRHRGWRADPCHARDRVGNAPVLEKMEDRTGQHGLNPHWAAKGARQTQEIAIRSS